MHSSPATWNYFKLGLWLYVIVEAIAIGVFIYVTLQRKA
jgi:hypothetical protein